MSRENETIEPMACIAPNPSAKTERPADCVDDLPAARCHPANLKSHVYIEDKLITKDILNLIEPHLSDKQRKILIGLMCGCGVREIARNLGITHPAVIKHRRKIAAIADMIIRNRASAIDM